MEGLVAPGLTESVHILLQATEAGARLLLQSRIESLGHEL
jgi:hypothetical protein